MKHLLKRLLDDETRTEGEQVSSKQLQADFAQCMGLCSEEGGSKELGRALRKAAGEAERLLRAEGLCL